MSAALRLFVASYPTLDVVRSLKLLLRGQTLPAGREVPDGQVHLTVLFLGARRVAELDETLKSVEAATRGLPAFTLTFDRLTTFPMTGPSRLVAAVAPPSGVLDELNRRLATRLSRRPSRGLGELRPHLTLLRFGQPQVLARWEVTVPRHPLEVRHVSLVRSVLLPEGAEHRTVATFALK